MKKILALLSMSAVLAAVAMGAVAEGKWSAQGPAAPKELSLHVSGTSLSGTLDGVAITKGGVGGDYLWFQSVNNGVTIQYKGRIAGGKIMLREVGPKMQRQLVFGRAR